jgi:hypothetical protein
MAETHPTECDTPPLRKGTTGGEEARLCAQTAQESSKPGISGEVK